MGKEIKCYHLRFNLEKEIESKVWQWLHSAALENQKSLNGFLIELLSREMSGGNDKSDIDAFIVSVKDNVSDILSESMADILAERIAEKLSSRIQLTDLHQSVNPSPKPNSDEGAGDVYSEAESGESLESCIPEEALDFMGGY